METANRGTELVQPLSRLTHRRAPEYTNSDLEEVLREINYLATRTLPSQIKVHLPEELNHYKWLRGQNHYDSFLLS